MTALDTPPPAAFAPPIGSTPPPSTVQLSMVGALNLAHRHAMDADESVVVMGQDVATAGGVFRVTEGLLDRFGHARCFDTPLAESAIVGTGIGMAMRGVRPIAEIQFDGFLYPALDQLVSHAAKLRSRTAGEFTVPLTVRVPSWGGIGAAEHHSESLETYLCHTAGLTVLSPADPQDAYHLLRAAVDLDDPVVVLEPKRRYWSTAMVDTTAAALPWNRAMVRRRGSHATVVTYGELVATALEAAAQASASHGWELEVVDLRCLAPMDADTVFESVGRTGRCVVLHEAARSHGYGAEVAARVTEELFGEMEAPVLRATGFDTPYPPARLEGRWLPGVDRLLDAVEATFTWDASSSRPEARP